MTPRTPADRISAKAILVGRVAAGIAHDCADLTDREAASGWGRSRRAYMISLTDMEQMPCDLFWPYAY
jgi:hypothetical protein